MRKISNGLCLNFTHSPIHQVILTCAFSPAYSLAAFLKSI